MKLIMNPDGRTGIVEAQGYAADIALVKADIEQHTDQIDISTFEQGHGRMYINDAVETIVTATFRTISPMRRIERRPDDPFPKRIVEVA